MKHIRNILLLTLIIVILCFTGCSAEYTVGSIEKNNSTSMSMEYVKFTGTKYKIIEVKENETIDVFVNITTEAGKLDLIIEDEVGKSQYSGQDLESTEFTVTLKNSGKYTITIKAKDHKGSYKISWNKSESI